MIPDLTAETKFSGFVPRVNLLDVTIEPTDAELAALMHVAGDSARVVIAANKIRIELRLAQAILDLDIRLGLK